MDKQTLIDEIKSLSDEKNELLQLTKESFIKRVDFDYGLTNTEIILYRDHFKIKFPNFLIRIANHCEEDDFTFNPTMNVKAVMDLSSPDIVLFNIPFLSDLSIEMANKGKGTNSFMYTIIEKYFNETHSLDMEIESKEIQLQQILKFENMDQKTNELEVIKRNFKEGSNWFIQKRSTIELFLSRGNSLGLGKLHFERITSKTATIVYYDGIIDHNKKFLYKQKDRRRIPVDKALELLYDYDINENKSVTEKINECNTEPVQ